MINEIILHVNSTISLTFINIRDPIVETVKVFIDMTVLYLCPSCICKWFNSCIVYTYIIIYICKNDPLQAVAVFYVCLVLLLVGFNFGRGKINQGFNNNYFEDFLKSKKITFLYSMGYV